jgi:hypothetical protein
MTLRFHLIPVERPSSRKQITTKAGDDSGEKELLYTVGGNVNQCSHYRKQNGDSTRS